MAVELTEKRVEGIALAMVFAMVCQQAIGMRGKLPPSIAQLADRIAKTAEDAVVAIGRHPDYRLQPKDETE